MSNETEYDREKLTGLEVLFSAVVPSREADVIVLVIHWSFIRKGYLCVGLDDPATESNAINVGGSELPATGWNTAVNPVVYALKYISIEEKYFSFKVVQTQNILFASSLNIENGNVYSSSFVIDDHVEKEFTSFSKAFRNLESLHQLIMRDLVLVLDPPPKKISKKKSRKCYKSTLDRSPRYQDLDTDDEFDMHYLEVVERRSHPDLAPMPGFDNPNFM